jgi:hypothetical protein
MYPFLMKLYADGGYQGPLFRRAVAKIRAPRIIGCRFVLCESRS